MKKRFAATLFFAAVCLLLPAQASVFTPLKVVNAPAYDPLNARNWPSTVSAVARTYTTGAMLSGTGRCKNTASNVSFAIDGSQSIAWKYNKMKAPNVWCQIWHDAPAGSGNYKAGWVRGKFVKPL